jgi:hypothetical protein
MSSHATRDDARRVYFLPSLKLRNTKGNQSLWLKALIITEVADMDDGRKKHVQIREYIYQIISEQDNKPLFEFHWHPEKFDRNTLEPRIYKPGEKPPFPYPHVHVRAQDNRFDNLHKKHIPTGQIVFEDVLYFLLTDCGMKPLRKDWEEVLATTKKNLVQSTPPSRD